MVVRQKNCCHCVHTTLDAMVKDVGPSTRLNGVMGGTTHTISGTKNCGLLEDIGTIEYHPHLITKTPTVTKKL